MIEFKNGDLFASDCEAIVNGVNCVGAYGKGIALGVKLRWPGVYASYRADCGVGLSCEGVPDARRGAGRDQGAPPCCRLGSTCRVHKVRPGEAILRPTGTTGIAAVLDVPTKRHWRDASLLDDVAAAVPALARAIVGHGLRSVAVPPLGCGNGGLEWAVVGPLVVAGLRDLDARIVVFGAPVGA